MRHLLRLCELPAGLAVAHVCLPLVSASTLQPLLKSGAVHSDTARERHPRSRADPRPLSFNHCPERGRPPALAVAAAATEHANATNTT